MKKLLLSATALLILTLASCFQNETTIHLNKDGSGTLVEETRLGAQMIAMIDQMAGLGGENTPDPIQEMFSEQKAKARAARLGQGVSHEKTEPIRAEGAIGARVTYRFKDINQLRIATDDSMKNLSPGGKMPAANPTPPVGFSYAEGKLTIRMPQPGKPAAPEDAAKPDMTRPEAQAMIKQMLGDMKMSLKLVIEPGIAESNASHQDGNIITLMQLDMAKLVENPASLKQLATVDQDDPTAAMQALNGLDGVKLESRQEVTVTVK